MIPLAATLLTLSEQRALPELQQRLATLDFAIASMTLYGSVARGAADEESDIDLLILTSHPLSRPERHKITDLVFEVNLLHDTNFSTLVVNRHSWESGPLSLLPLHDEVVREGVTV